MNIKKPICTRKEKVTRIAAEKKPATRKKTKSVFMQMHDGERTGEGSFNMGLQKLFYLADSVNRCKLVKAFPDFFGKSVPEFGIK